MSLSQALLTATAGLRTVQTGLSLVSSNVANAETPGYVRKTLTSTTTITGSVNVGAVNRELDQYLLRQLRLETAGGSYADLRAQFYDRVQLSFGQPGAAGTLETVFSDFMGALQALGTSPESPSARSHAVSAAGLLAQQLNRMTADIQGLRSDAEAGLAHSSAVANEAMEQIANLNHRIAAMPKGDVAAATLKDQRDRYINQLAELMDIRVINGADERVSVFTASGVFLVGAEASRLEFNAQGSVNANTQWSADPAERTLGTLTLVSPGGDRVDLLANSSIRSGAIAAYVEMRDSVLVEAQAQLDAIAAAMAQALSTETIVADPVSDGGLDGFDIDLDGMIAGNSVRVSYTDIASGEQRTVTLMRVDDPGALPLADSATADPSDRVFGIDFSGGMASVVAQVSAALGSSFTVSNPSGDTLRILDDGGTDVVMNGLGGSRTATGLAGGGLEIPLFTDGASPYSGAVTAGGGQMIGFAGRIAVNPALVADPGALVFYAPGTEAGDTSRPEFIFQRLSQTSLVFPPEAGIGSASSPYQGSLSEYLRQVIFQQGDAAANADLLNQGQTVVVNALEERFGDSSGVNIDREMAHLLQLQTAYSANARVMSAVREMLDTLMRM